MLKLTYVKLNDKLLELSIYDLQNRKKLIPIYQLFARAFGAHQCDIDLSCICYVIACKYIQTLRSIENGESFSEMFNPCLIVVGL